MPERGNSQSEMPERGNSLIYPQDVKITDPENNDTPISYQEFKALLGLTRANSSREEELEKKNKRTRKNIKKSTNKLTRTP